VEVEQEVEVALVCRSAINLILRCCESYLLEAQSLGVNSLLRATVIEATFEISLSPVGFLVLTIKIARVHLSKTICRVAFLGRIIRKPNHSTSQLLNGCKNQILICG
jgi:hypothetical protein